MTMYFAEYGPRLVRLGYDTLPATGKAIFIPDWQSMLVDEGQVAKWAANGQAGKNVGVRCGALSAVDLDILDADVCATVQADFEDRFGVGLQRVGRAPKRLMVYTASRPIKKMKVAWVDPGGVVHGVEILGAGQQFIAYGMHPDTGREYEWEGDSLLDLEAWEVPALRVDEVAVWLRDVLPTLVPPGWELITKSSDLVEGGSHRSVSDPRLKAGIVGAVCRTWSISAAIAEFLGDVYAQTDQIDRYVYLHGTSKLGGAVVYDDDTYLNSNHNSDPASGKLRNVFDLLRIHMFGHLDDKDDPFHNETMGPSFDAMKAWAKGRDDVLDELEHPLTTEMLRMLKATCGRRIEVSDEVVRGALERVMWQHTGSTYLLARAGSLVPLRERDIIHSIEGDMGSLFDVTEVSRAVATHTGLTGAPLAKAVTEAIGGPRGALMRWLRDNRNALGAVEYRCDPFATAPRISVRGEVATYTYPWEPLAVGAVVDRYIDDYKQHFPQFDAFLDLLVAARFASSRRTAYLWMHCPSSWGKSFLLHVMSSLRIATEVKMPEIKGMANGGPAGKGIEDFQRSLVLVVDEFSGVNKETKELTDSIRFSPKYKSEVRFPLYLKLFLSAEGAESLLSESGIEDQFANRFMYLSGTGTLDERHLFATHKMAYAQSVTAYVAQRINTLIEHYVGLQTPVAASEAADKVLAQWYEEYRIDKRGARLSDAMDEIAEEFRDWALFEYERGRLDGEWFVNATGAFIANAGGVIGRWIATKDKSVQGMLSYKKAEIVAALGGRKAQRVWRATEEKEEQKVRKVVQLLATPSEVTEESNRLRMEECLS